MVCPQSRTLQNKFLLRSQTLSSKIESRIHSLRPLIYLFSQCEWGNSSIKEILITKLLTMFLATKPINWTKLCLAGRDAAASRLIKPSTIVEVVLVDLQEEKTPQLSKIQVGCNSSHHDKHTLSYHGRSDVVAIRVNLMPSVATMFPHT